MGLFNVFRNSKKDRMLVWQNFVMTVSNPDKLVASEKQLRSISQRIIENDLRIINDCRDIISSTTNPDTFFSRMDLLEEKAKELAFLEEFMAFRGPSPKAALNQIHEQYQLSISMFLKRYYGDTVVKSESLKTMKGKQARYQKFYDSLQKYYHRMSQENIQYIEKSFATLQKLLNQ